MNMGDSHRQQDDQAHKRSKKHRITIVPRIPVASGLQANDPLQERLQYTGDQYWGGLRQADTGRQGIGHGGTGQWQNLNRVEQGGECAREMPKYLCQPRIRDALEGALFRFGCMCGWRQM